MKINNLYLCTPQKMNFFLRQKTEKDYLTSFSSLNYNNL